MNGMKFCLQALDPHGRFGTDLEICTVKGDPDGEGFSWCHSEESRQVYQGGLAFPDEAMGRVLERNCCVQFCTWQLQAHSGISR